METLDGDEALERTRKAQRKYELQELTPITKDILSNYGIQPETDYKGFWFKYNRKKQDWRVYKRGVLILRIKTERQLIKLINRI